jgi:hypothetical protein
MEGLILTWEALLPFLTTMKIDASETKIIHGARMIKIQTIQCSPKQFMPLDF